MEVLHTPDPWYGVTYQEDKPMVKAAIRAMEERGRVSPGILKHGRREFQET